jgi:hypothetical protein
MQAQRFADEAEAEVQLPAPAPSHPNRVRFDAPPQTPAVPAAALPVNLALRL